ncbi:hypothetical protein PCC9214_05454 (plasmid) [Planktothrix tepida]|uniref:Fe2OG dioxygenase domain-containing protein n=1 Tax=Planktothrix tepida PCC 9214 TaxID=671072 RepID=A0A1J1LNE8_9CYAN|nr:hypothetical protein [Planktothrix tepida]CAD5988746.1 hypothetical protein PCC9214_05454 [Planktothrix tepida]CUR33943.1 conserved hypothetical protein [Planktothrix tepida PCC 9214]
MNKTKLNFATELRKLTTVENPEALRNWCQSLKSQLVADPSNYAKGRYRLWIFHDVDFRNGKLSKGYFDDRIYNFSQRVYPGCDIGLLTFGGQLDNNQVSDGRIGLHRDHSYANPKAVSVNLGEAIFSYGEPEQTDYLLQDGDIIEFNCKILHAVKEILTEERFSLVFWKLNKAKGFKSLY